VISDELLEIILLTRRSSPIAFKIMSGQVVLLTDAYQPPTMRLVGHLRSAGVATLFEGLHDSEVVMSNSAERKIVTNGDYSNKPFAVLFEVDTVMEAEDLHSVARHAANVYPEIPLIACRRVSEEFAFTSLRPLDQPLLRRLGFKIIVDSPTQLPEVLDDLKTTTQNESVLKADTRQEDEWALGNLLLPKNLTKKELRAAFELVSSLHFASDQKSAALTALAGLGHLMQADRWTVYLNGELEEEKISLEPLAVRGLTQSEQEVASTDWQSALTNEELRFEGKESKAAMEAIKKNETVRRKENNRFVVAVPLISGEKVFGVMEGIREGDAIKNFRKTEIALLNALVVPVAASIANAVRIADAERLSQTDDLTKLHNARFLKQCITIEIRRARRLGQKVSALFLDIDNFKSINDVHGHLVGSHILLEMAGVLRTSVRTTDIVTRYGGDEFVAILPNTDLELAAIVAERIRERLSKHRFTGGQGLKLKITASFGVAVFPEHASSPQQLMAAADAAMYEAKAAQKDCIRFANVSLVIFSEKN